VPFADLKGSMELLADRDPEEGRKILDPVLEGMMEAVHRYEGTVNQVMGDERYPQYPALQIEGLDAKTTIEGMTGPQDLPALTEGLLRRHFADVDVRKILGANFLRVFRGVLGVPSPLPG